MLTSIHEDSGLLREWAPLSTLLQKIPAKIQTGIFSQDINFTCIDVVTEFIIIGTNHGLLYWYDRNLKELQAFGCEDNNSSITCVRIVSTVDYMVAAGNSLGIVTIFQIPKAVPDSLPESLKPKKKKQVERFVISDLHKVSVTSLEWSKNGMKLFSGDQNGLVVLTEMDFYLHLSKSSELLNEKYSVVQLSYQNGLLLISTLFRTIVVDRNNKNQVTQIGQKERKMFGKLGAVFFQNKNNRQEHTIYASRPGLRIWQADQKGIVTKTLILKDSANVEENRVQLLNPASDSFIRKSRELAFGTIVPFKNDLLLTYNEDVIYIINPAIITITSIALDFRKITDLACTEDEIFVVEGERNIVRIASYPEICSFDAVKNELTNDLKPIVELNKAVSWGLSELTSKLKSSSFITAIPFYKLSPSNLIQSTNILPPVIIGIDTTSIIKAEEAIEVPISQNQATNVAEMNTKFINRRAVFQKIAEQDFEEVVFNKKKKNKKVKFQSDMDINVIKNEVQSDSYSLQSSLQKIDYVHTLESETITKAVQEKEKLLSNYLNLDLSKCTNKNKIITPDSPSYKSIDFKEYADDCRPFTITDKTQYTFKHESNGRRLKEKDVQQECSTNIIETNTNDAMWRTVISTEKRNTLENQFNGLSKDLIKSTLFQDTDDWILLG